MAFFSPLNCAILNDCVCCCTSVTVPEMSQPYPNKKWWGFLVLFSAIYIFLFSQVLASLSFLLFFFSGDRKDALFNLWQTNRSEVVRFVSVLGTHQVKILDCVAYFMSVVMRREWEMVVSCFLKEIIAKNYEFS